MTHDVDEMETQLGALFRAQASAIDVADREWSDVPLAPVMPLQERRTSRTKRGFMIGGSVLVAAVVALTVGLYGVGQPQVQTKAPAAQQPNAPRTINFVTDSKKVSLAASDYKIVANGKTFTTKGVKVEVHGDPGSADYWTLELGWNEQGVRQSMNMYFASDGDKWWVSEIRVYNGKAEGDWITWTGTFFRTPVGKSYTGDVNLVDKSSGASLTITNMLLTTVQEKFNCNAGSGEYAIGTSFERPTIDLITHGSEMGTQVFLLDRGSCAKAPHAERYSFSWTSDDRTIASVSDPQKTSTDTVIPNVAPAGDCGSMVDQDGCRRGAFPTYVGGKAGKTVLHATARDTATGEVVARRDFPVSVSSDGVVPATVGATP